MIGVHAEPYPGENPVEDDRGWLIAANQRLA